MVGDCNRIRQIRAHRYRIGAVALAHTDIVAAGDAKLRNKRIDAEIMSSIQRAFDGKFLTRAGFAGDINTAD